MKLSTSCAPVFVAAALLFAATQLHAASMARLEWDVETDTLTTSLPEQVPSTIFARSCIRCKSTALRVENETKFFIGTEPVSLQTLREAARKRHFMMVFYDPDRSVVTRIVIHGASVQAPSKATGR